MVASERTERPELLAASDEVIEDAVRYAEPMVLRGLLYQLTGDPELEAMALKRVRMGRMEIVSPATDDDVAMLRRKAAGFLKAHRDAGAGPIGQWAEGAAAGKPGADRRRSDQGGGDRADGRGDRARSLGAVAAMAGGARSRAAREFLGDGHRRRDGRAQRRGAAQARRHPLPGDREERECRRNLWENRYPGARVDTPSRGYTNLFGVDFPYPYAYGPHTESQKYYDWVADTFDLRATSRFNTEVPLAGLGRGGGDVGNPRRRPRGRDGASVQRSDHRGRLPQPAQHSRDRGNGGVRGPGLAHRALA